MDLEDVFKPLLGLVLVVAIAAATPALLNAALSAVSRTGTTTTVDYSAYISDLYSKYSSLANAFSTLASRLDSLDLSLGTLNLSYAAFKSYAAPLLQWVERVNITETASYIVFTDGSRYYAKNGSTGAIEYSDSDASKVIQYAIDNIPVPGGTVFIRRGDYYLSKAIRITKYINLVGEGVGATRLILAPNANSRMIEYCIDPSLIGTPNLVSPHMYIAYLMLHGNKGYQASGSEAIITQAEGNCTQVADWMMFDVWLHRYKGNGVRIKTTHNWVILHSSIEHNDGAAVYLDSSDEGAIAFSLLYNNQHGIYVNNVWNAVRLIGNRIEVFSGTAISIISSRFVIAVGNYIRSVVVRPSYYIYINNSNRNLIANNIINVVTGAVADYGVYEDGSSDYNIIVNNVLSNANIEPVRLVGANSRAVNNYAVIGIGTLKLSSNSGVATIPAGQTRVTVPHGLYKTPTKFQITPLGQPPGKLWVENITPTSFDIVTDTAPSSNLNVAWYAEV